MIVQVIGDGNCFFHSTALGLGNPEPPHRARANLRRFLSDSSRAFSPSDWFLQELEEDKQWVSYDEATRYYAEYINCNIVCYTSNSNTLPIHSVEVKEYPTLEELFLGSLNNSDDGAVESNICSLIFEP